LNRVALILGQDLGFCRGVLRGVQSFANRHESWIFRDAAPVPEVIAPLREWNPAGIIAHLFDQSLADELLRLGKPVVNVTSTLAELKVPLVEVDHLAVGKMAARYFLDAGFRNFGYFGSRTAGFSHDRERGFCETVEAAGHRCLSCYAEYLPRPALGGSWLEIDEQVKGWLLSLPKPVAIFASNDVPARELAEVCRLLNLQVPEEVALLGVDNDELECGLAYPPLSSIAIPSERVGFEAAAILSQMMAGKPPPAQPLFLPPKAVVVRQSSDVVAVEDPDLSAVLRFIRQHAAEPITVETILAHVPVSRRKLERTFSRVMNRTILDEIRRVRIERVKRLLSTTDLQMPAIATQAGFESARRLATVFRQMTGITPTDYRNQFRRG
jgi:LacI family transcriptional regulator